MREMHRPRCPQDDTHDVDAYDPADPNDPWIPHVCTDRDCAEEFVVHADDL